MTERRKTITEIIYGTGEEVGNSNPVLPSPDAVFIFLENIRNIRKVNDTIHPTVGEKLYRIKSLAHWLDIPRPTLMAEIKAGRLHSIKIKNRLHVSTSDAMAWLRKAIQARGERSS